LFALQQKKNNMHAFMIKTPGGRFYVKPSSTERFMVDVNGEEVVMEKDEDGYVRAPGATRLGHRLNMGLLNMIADEIYVHTA
jgi:hypothetical protein